MIKIIDCFKNRFYNSSITCNINCWLVKWQKLKNVKCIRTKLKEITSPKEIQNHYFVIIKISFNKPHIPSTSPFSIFWTITSHLDPQYCVLKQITIYSTTVFSRLEKTKHEYNFRNIIFIERLINKKHQNDRWANLEICSIKESYSSIHCTSSRTSTELLIQSD